jgi:flagellar motor switch protein FliN
MPIDVSTERPAEKHAGDKPADHSVTTSATASETKRKEEDEAWGPVLNLPCNLTVELPLPSFRVADLLKLRQGSVISTHWALGRDVPLRINGTVVGWSELEVVNNRLAVRLTELA